jgi:transposase-like protein
VRGLGGVRPRIPSGGAASGGELTDTFAAIVTDDVLIRSTTPRASKNTFRLVPLKEHLSKTILADRIQSLWAEIRQIEPDAPILRASRRPAHRARRLSDERAAEVGAAYRAGGTVSGLARQLEIDRGTVRSALRRAEVPQRPQARVLTPEETERACRLYQEGLGLKVVGAQLGVDYRVVRRGLVAAGVEVRQRGRLWITH